MARTKKQETEQEQIEGEQTAKRCYIVIVGTDEVAKDPLDIRILPGTTGKQIKTKFKKATDFVLRRKETGQIIHNTSDAYKIVQENDILLLNPPSHLGEA